MICSNSKFLTIINFLASTVENISNKIANETLEIGPPVAEIRCIKEIEIRSFFKSHPNSLLISSTYQDLRRKFLKLSDPFGNTFF